MIFGIIRSPQPLPYQKRGADLMINQITQNENVKNQFSNAIRELQIGKLLRRANIIKSCGISAYGIFRFLLLLVFQGKNLFRLLNSKRKDTAVSKNTYYRFLNDTSFNWTKFLLLLSAKVTSALSTLTKPKYVKVLVLDDSVFKHSRSKDVELLAWVYDHVEHKYQKGFTMLTLGWSDGTVLCQLASTCFHPQRKATI